jgi:hypothetical protein
LQPVVIPPHATLMQPSAVSAAASPSFLDKPSGFPGGRIDHRHLRRVSMENDRVRQTGNLRVIVSDPEMV